LTPTRGPTCLTAAVNDNDGSAPQTVVAC